VRACYAETRIVGSTASLPTHSVAAICLLGRCIASSSVTTWKSSTSPIPLPPRILLSSRTIPKRRFRLQGLAAAGGTEYLADRRFGLVVQHSWSGLFKKLSMTDFPRQIPQGGGGSDET
jgi:hypothetical protein